MVTMLVGLALLFPIGIFTYLSYLILTACGTFELELGGGLGLGDLNRGTNNSSGGSRIAGLRWPPRRKGSEQPERTRVLCVHGTLDNAASYVGLGPALAGDGCDVVAIDLPGHGRASRRPAAQRLLRMCHARHSSAAFAHSRLRGCAQTRTAGPPTRRMVTSSACCRCLTRSAGSAAC